MTRQNNPSNTGRDRKAGDNRRDAASHVLRYESGRPEQRSGQERERGHRDVSMSRRYLNDLYERSSI